MDGEWPVLLRTIGKNTGPNSGDPSSGGAHLSVADVRALFAERRLPERITRRLDAG